MTKHEVDPSLKLIEQLESELSSLRAEVERLKRELADANAAIQQMYDQYIGGTL